MKKIALAVSALSLMATPVLAQNVPVAGPTQSSVVEVTGSVPKLCGVGFQSGGGSSNVVDADFDIFTDNQGRLNTSLSKVVEFGNIWCNTPATLKMEVSKFAHVGPIVPTSDPSSFDSQFDLLVTPPAGGGIFVYLGGATQASSAGAPIENTGLQAFETGTGQYQRANVAIRHEAGSTDRPYAGDYAGTITVTATVN